MIVVLIASGLSACVNNAQGINAKNTRHIHGLLTQGAAVDKQIHSRTVANEAKLFNPTVPDTVSRMLMPSATEAIKPHIDVRQRMNITVNDVPAQTFFIGLAKNSKKSIVVSPNITGKLTLNLKNVTLLEVMDAIKALYGYDYTKTDFGFEIFPRKLQTRIFYVSHLDIERSGSSSMSINSSNLTSTAAASSGTSGSSVSTTSKTAFWVELKRSLSLLIDLNPDRKLSKDARTNEPSLEISQDTGTIVMRAYPDQLRTVAKFLAQTERILKRQVIIEAKVLDVQLDDQYSTGINWNLLTLSSAGSRTLLPVESGLLSNVFKLTASAGNNFSAVVNMLSSQGRVSVLSSPQVSTLNNQKAVIKIGKDNYFITNLSVNTTTTSGANSQVADLTIQPFFSGVALDVTPEVDKRNNVTLHIHPVISRVKDEVKEVDIGGSATKLPLAASTVREVDSIVRAKSGEVIVIGGLMETSTIHKRSGPPLHKKLGFFSKLLTNKDDSGSKDELVILLRPIVVKPDTWSEHLDHASDTVFQPQD